MTIYKITPDPNCPICRGSGEVYEHHPYGSTTATETLWCDCMVEQLPEEWDDWNDEIELVTLPEKLGPGY